jgi:hypothetical protein
VYIAAKWDFNITEDERTGRWMLGHGFDHGMWIAQPDTVVGNGRWGLFWWNGEFCLRVMEFEGCELIL